MEKIKSYLRLSIVKIINRLRLNLLGDINYIILDLIENMSKKERNGENFKEIEKLIYLSNNFKFNELNEIRNKDLFFKK